MNHSKEAAFDERCRQLIDRFARAVVNNLTLADDPRHPDREPCLADAARQSAAAFSWASAMPRRQKGLDASLLRVYRGSQHARRWRVVEFSGACSEQKPFGDVLTVRDIGAPDVALWLAEGFLKLGRKYGRDVTVERIRIERLNGADAVCPCSSCDRSAIAVNH